MSNSPISVQVITGGSGADLIILTFPFTSGCWPFDEPASATMTVRRGHGEAYAQEHWPDLPREVVILQRDS